MKILALIILLMLSMAICSASSIGNQVGEGLDNIKWVHIGAGYIINDQLKRHTHLTTSERILTISFLIYAKENWVDYHANNGDITATVVGSLFHEIKF